MVQAVLTGRSLDRALILLGLASECLCIFGLYGATYVVIFFLASISLPFSELSLVGLGLDLVD